MDRQRFDRAGTDCFFARLGQFTYSVSVSDCDISSEREMAVRSGECLPSINFCCVCNAASDLRITHTQNTYLDSQV